MAENFKLPGSSYEELVKIIKAYSTGKVGTPMSLDAIAQTTGMDKTIVSRNNGFLVQMGFIAEGNKKAPTQEGVDLGRAYSLKMDEQIVRIWKSKIESDEFLSRMLSAVKIRNGMEKSSFINHILYSSGSNTNNNTRAGANTIIEIFKSSNLVSENDGTILASDNIESDASDICSINQTSSTSIPVSNTTISTVSANGRGVTVNLNINIDISIDQIDSLSDKINALIENLQK